MALFVVKLMVKEKSQDISYDSIVSCLKDFGLKGLFDKGLVTECTLFCGETRMAGLPSMKWDRFQDMVISNATAIFRKSDLTP